MKKYEAPTAQTVEFESVNIIATSDTPDLLITWGEAIEKLSAKVTDFYK